MSYATRGVLLGVLAMTVVVVASNILVQHPIQLELTVFGIPADHLWTWGALSYPVAFLVTDLCNRSMGPAKARRVVYAGFAVAVLLSAAFAGWRIALASGTAFLLAQLLDVLIFDRLRRMRWWQAPLISSGLASTLDTLVFFSLAFAGTAVPWPTLALGDYAVKLAVAVIMLVPFRALMSFLPRAELAPSR
ncbi:hypothetical protein SAMN06265365_101248 [Tistlia consotensis]|uniref:Probable queuosine precursor transporter n=1 Tax=Tistlia consotensis USBA 355 TaxID=560819 RepID=A0A1Y6B8D8_9PROT|nr:queuosine precursor transporter [Tistlia consotensis]SME89730.1 hypothetical protein SAMN05428998_101246 [Tistlia consotensis USBA 355]SNR26247.1 hypothetical protein SAMN06265365_101248 [Tistlia consotensis]